MYDLRPLGLPMKCSRINPDAPSRLEVGKLLPNSTVTDCCILEIQYLNMEYLWTLIETCESVLIEKAVSFVITSCEMSWSSYTVEIKWVANSISYWLMYVSATFFE